MQGHNIKQLKLEKSFSINLFQKINNLILHIGRSNVDYVKSSVRYKIEKEIYFN